MIHYITSFIVYTLAMVGLMIIGYVVYKKTFLMNPVKKNSMLNIVDMLRLPDRKILYVIKCKDEQFLIASSNDKVTLISKLTGGKNEQIERYLSEQKQEESAQEYFGESEKPSNKRVIKSLLKELSDKNQFKRGNY